MRLLIAFCFIVCSFATNAQPVEQSGNITPGHAACFAITGVIYDCGSPGGGVSVVGSTTTNDFVSFNASGSLIDSGINPANTSAISGLWNFNGGATAPTRPNGDNTTNVATTAFIASFPSTNLTFSGNNTFTGTNFFSNTVTFSNGVIFTGTIAEPVAFGTNVSITNSGINITGSTTVTSNPGTNGSANNWFLGSTLYSGDTAFIATMAPGFTGATVSGITAGAPNGAIAGIFGAQCSKNVSGGFLQCGAALTLLTYADTMRADGNGIFTTYTQGNLLATSDPVAVGGGRFYGYIPHEISIVNDWGFVATDPYTINPNGGVHGLRLDCGNGPAGHNNCGGAALEVVPNPALMGAAINCSNGSLVTSTLLGVSGLGQCGMLADKHSLVWYSAASTVEAMIYANLSSTVFLHFATPLNGTYQFDIAGAPSVSIATGIIFPSTNNSVALGSSSFRFSNVFGVSANLTGILTVPFTQASTIFSAAGTPVPTCNLANNALSVIVSDATGATYAGAYTSGGAQTRRVLCVNGTGWITD